jgi:hypothetical protein
MILVIGALIAGGVCGIIEGNKLLTWYCFIMVVVFIIPSLQIPFSVATHIKPPRKYGQVNIKFLDDRIEIYSKRVTDSKPYSRIKRINEIPNFFLIVFADDKKELSYLPVKKDGLNCEPEDFYQFISDRIAPVIAVTQEGDA